MHPGLPSRLAERPGGGLAPAAVSSPFSGAQDTAWGAQTQLCHLVRGPSAPVKNSAKKYQRFPFRRKRSASHSRQVLDRLSKRALAPENRQQRAWPAGSQPPRPWGLSVPPGPVCRPTRSRRPVCCSAEKADWGQGLRIPLSSSSFGACSPCPHLGLLWSLCREVPLEGCSPAPLEPLGSAHVLCSATPPPRRRAGPQSLSGPHAPHPVDVGSPLKRRWVHPALLSPLPHPG